MKTTELRDMFNQLDNSIRKMEVTQLEASMEQMKLTMTYIQSGYFGMSFEEEVSTIGESLDDIKRAVRKMRVKLFIEQIG